MRNAIFLFLLTVLGLPVAYADGWNDFLHFSFGSEGYYQLGAESLSDNAYAFSAQSFAFSDEYLYVADSIGNRVLVFSLNGSPVRIFNIGMRKIHYYSKILLDGDDYMYLIARNFGILKYSIQKENVIWELLEKDIPKVDYKWTSFQIFDHKLIYFDYRTTTTPYAIDENGTYLGQVDYAKDNPKRLVSLLKINRAGKDEKIKKAIDDALGSVPNLVDGYGRVFTETGSEVRTYATVLRTIRELLTPAGTKAPIYAWEPFTDKEIAKNNCNIVDFDHEGNSLWGWLQPIGEYKYNYYYVVFNRYGELLKIIDLSLFKEANFGAPDGIHFDYAGNIYAFWMHTTKGAILYKYARTW